MTKRTASIYIIFGILAIMLCGCSVVQARQPDTLPSASGSGWAEVDGQKCYILEGGSPASGWLELDGNRYYFRSNGTMVTGWLSLEGQRYYLDESGAAVCGPADLDGTSYLFDSIGRLTSGWAEVDGIRYCGDDNGHPLTGWIETDEGRFYLDESGAMAAGWQEMEGKTCYFLPDGTLATGIVTIDGENHCFASNGQKILLVNPWNRVPDDYYVKLVSIGEGHRIAAEAKADFDEMLTACKAAGMDPVVVSSYRTQEYQEALYEKKTDYFLKLGFSEEDAAAQAGTTVALPGTSEHQLGLAVDIIDEDNNRLDESQAGMPTQKWLMKNSWRYGWILRYPTGKSEITGIIYEPWHYRYVGREIAAEIHELDVCLEEYLQLLTAK